MTPESISLYFCEGSSDKEYHVELVAKDAEFVVNFRYGRRGSALTSGTKSKTPLPYEKAKALYDKVVRKQLREGYTPGESGSAYQATALEARYTGILPQLLNAIDEAELPIVLNDDQFIAQEKLDGKRCLIRRTAEGVEGINRRGLVIALPARVAAEMQRVFVSAVILDGELVGEVFHAFDQLEEDNRDWRGRPYRERLNILGHLLPTEGEFASPALRVVPLAQGVKEKRALLERIRAQRGEGVVFKHLEAPYVAGRPASGGPQRKFKFTASATCRVAARNGAKRSVSLELIDADRWVGVGNVTIPANYSVPEVGTLCEVEYLYAFKGGSLYQPVYRGTREDLTFTAASLAQLKYKPDSEEEEG